MKRNSLLLISLLLIPVWFVSCGKKSELSTFIEQGNTEEISKLLEKGLNPNDTLANGRSLVYQAIQEDQIEVLRQLVEAGATICYDDRETDHRFMAIEIGHKDITKWLMDRNAKFYNRDHYYEIATLLVQNDWVDLLEGYDLQSRLDKEETLELLAMANLDGSVEMQNYLIGLLRNFWSVTEFAEYSRELDETLDEINFMRPLVIEQMQFVDQGVILKLDNGEEFLEEILKDYLSKPLLNDDGYKSALKNSYFHNVTVLLPKFLPVNSRHEGYYSNSEDRVTYKTAMAYFIHRTRRSNENIELLWSIWKGYIFEKLTPEMYVDLDFYRSVETLIETFDSIKTVPGYKDLLQSSWDRIEQIHNGAELDEYGVYGMDWYLGIEEQLLFNNQHDVNIAWLSSFWIRRYHEGNYEVVEQILREIREHYSTTYELKTLVEERRIKDVTKRFLVCAEYNFVDELKQLSNEGVNVYDAVGTGGIREIHMAVMSDNKKKVSELLANGVYVDEPDQDGNTPLHYAVSVDMADLLLQHNAKLVSGYFRGHLARFISDENPSLVKWSLDNGANLQSQSDKRPILIRAIPCCSPELTSDKLEIIKILLNAGANPHDKMGYSKTPFEYAVQEGAGQVVKIFDALGK